MPNLYALFVSYHNILLKNSDKYFYGIVFYNQISSMAVTFTKKKLGQKGDVPGIFPRRWFTYAINNWHNPILKLLIGQFL